MEVDRQHSHPSGYCLQLHGVFLYLDGGAGSLRTSPYCLSGFCHRCEGEGEGNVQDFSIVPNRFILISHDPFAGASWYIAFKLSIKVSTYNYTIVVLRDVSLGSPCRYLIGHENFR